MELADDGTIVIEGEQVTLTPTEARALQFLLERAGQVVLRTTLERDVWGFATGTRSEAVPVALRGLRKKLGPHGRRLETLRGRGWRWSAEAPAPDVLAHSETLDLQAYSVDVSQDWATLTDACLDALGTLAEDPGGRLLARWVRHLDATGDLELRQRAIDVALAQHPRSLWVRVAAAPRTGDLDAVRLAVGAPDPELALHGLRAQLRIAPAEVRFDGIDLPEGPARAWLHAQELSMRLVREGPDAILPAFEAHMEASRIYPRLRCSMLYILGVGLASGGAPAHATAVLDSCTANASTLGLPHLGTIAKRYAAILRLHEEDSTTDELLEVADELDALGNPLGAADARIVARLVDAAHGRWERIRRTGRLRGTPALREADRWLDRVQRAQDGDQVAVEQLGACSSSPFVEAGEVEWFGEVLAAFFQNVLAPTGPLEVQLPDTICRVLSSGLARRSDGARR